MILSRKIDFRNAFVGGNLQKLALKGISGSAPSYQSNENNQNVLTIKSHVPQTLHPPDVDNFPKKMKVVVCGGGIIGSSVVYHLAKCGWAEHTVLLEQSEIKENSALLASGLAGRFKPIYSEWKLSNYSIDLIKELTEKGYDTGWKQSGSLSLARSYDRMIHFRRLKSQALAWGMECEILSPDECKDKCPIIDITDLSGGLWIGQDGVCDPDLLLQAFINEAKKEGVSVIENCAVKKIGTKNGKVSYVETTAGTVECDFFVNCSGFWAREMGTLSKPPVKIPLQSVEHHFLLTKEVEAVKSSGNIPYTRDFDGNIFFREKNGAILAGGFENQAKIAYEDGQIPKFPRDRHLPADWDQFQPLLDGLLRRVPLLKDVQLDKLVNIPESFSPDCKWILGESPEIQNYFVSTGMKTIGVSAAGGIGRSLADMITKGFPNIDLYNLDVSRFLGLHSNRKFLKNRGQEVPGLMCRIPYPLDEFQTGRNLRMSPMFHVLKEHGAVFGQTMGYERPTYFNSKDRMDEFGMPKFRIAESGTFGKPPWFDFVASEYAACRERVGLADYSSFTKYDLISDDEKDVVDLLQYLCSNDVDVAIGSIIHTGMQNCFGGYENDCSLVRLAENHYMMIAPTIQQTRSKAWIKKNMPADCKVNVSDVTSMFTAICIQGPYSRVLLSELTDTELTPKNFPFFTCMELDVGLANGIRAMNITHTGELGYVLYIPNEFASHVYQMLWEAGKKYGIQHAGYYATRALRIEKFYAFWGQDLDTSTTPLECGRSWRVKFNKDIDFIGREALVKQKNEGVKRMYVQLLLNNHDPDIDLWCWGGEPIYRNGKFCGMTTTTGFGFTFKQQVCLGFVRNFDDEGKEQPVTNDYVLNGHYEVEVGGLRFDAKVHLHSPNLPTKFPDKEREAYHATRDH